MIYSLDTGLGEAGGGVRDTSWEGLGGALGHRHHSREALRREEAGKMGRAF